MIDILTTPAFPQIGDITLFDHKHVPEGWVLVKGQVLDISKYPEIYARVGKTYGYTDDHTFILPDLNIPPEDAPDLAGFYMYMGANA